MKKCCPVCGFVFLNQDSRLPYYHGEGSIDICPCCRFEYAVSDDNYGYTFETWRWLWIRDGAIHCSRNALEDYDAAAQLSNIGIDIQPGFRRAFLFDRRSTARMRRFTLLVGIVVSAAWEFVLVIWDIVLRRSFDDYVYVNKDGTARELSSGERLYLAQEFLPGDGARPYIKGFYRARVLGDMSGFLLRRRLPSWVTVKPVDQDSARETAL